MCEQMTLYAIIHFEKEKYKEDMSLNQENKATGRPSEERKWMQYYPEIEYYGSNVPLFRRNGYRQSGTMIP